MWPAMLLSTFSDVFVLLPSCTGRCWLEMGGCFRGNVAEMSKHKWGQVKSDPSPDGWDILAYLLMVVDETRSPFHSKRQFEPVTDLPGKNILNEESAGFSCIDSPGGPLTRVLRHCWRLYCGRSFQSSKFLQTICCSSEKSWSRGKSDSYCSDCLA